MRLSESLRRGILDSFVGGITNRFKIGSRRRDTLFFEELLARYIFECEKAGFEKETMKMGEEWGYLVYKTLVPETIKKIPSLTLLTSILRSVWHNLGIIDELSIERNNNTVRMIAKNEAITRCIGANNLTVGFCMGTLEAVFGRLMQPLKIEQKKEQCEYTFILNNETASIDGRSKELYRKLNDFRQIEGYTLKNALKRGTFVLTGNLIYFRYKRVLVIENTLFHLIGKFNILPEKMRTTSYDFFKEIIDEKIDRDGKLLLLKTLFQIMGWGVINILIKKEGMLSIEIRSPPHGLLLKDNWNYIVRVFLGYIQLVDQKLRVSETKDGGDYILMEYSN